MMLTLLKSEVAIEIMKNNDHKNLGTVVNVILPDFNCVIRLQLQMVVQQDYLYI